MNVSHLGKAVFGKTFLVGLLAVLALGLSSLWAEEGLAQNTYDHAKIVGPNECGECHKKTVSLWKETHHSKTFTELPRNKEATAIAKKMGLKRIKSGSICLDCHFTTTISDGKRDPIAGITCESCHGPGQDYLKRHAEFSGKKKETESEAEMKQRWVDSEAAGMIRPHMLYTLAKNCYGCHTVPQEDLVNTGGHTAGSKFELVSWLQGEVRHNVWYTAGKSNPEADQNRKRLMFVVGLAVEIEVSLRAVAVATKKASYAKAMAKRAARAKKRFAAVAEALSEPEIAAIQAAAKGAKLKLNNEGPLTEAANAIGEAAMAFSKNYDGSTLGAIDSLIPGPDKYKGKPAG